MNMYRSDEDLEFFHIISNSLKNGEITLSPPMVYPKKTFPNCGLKIGILCPWG